MHTVISSCLLASSPFALSTTFLLSFSSSDSHKSSLRGKKNIAMPSVASVDQFLWRNYLIFACCSAMPSHSESRSLAQVVLDSG